MTYGDPTGGPPSALRSTARRAVLTALVAVLATAAPATAAPDRTAGREPDLQRALDRLVAAGAPGAVALVRERDRTTRRASGYGNLERSTPMRASDRFRIGSI